MSVFPRKAHSLSMILGSSFSEAQAPPRGPDTPDSWAPRSTGPIPYRVRRTICRLLRTHPWPAVGTSRHTPTSRTTRPGLVRACSRSVRCCGATACEAPSAGTGLTPGPYRSYDGSRPTSSRQWPLVPWARHTRPRGTWRRLMLQPAPTPAPAEASPDEQISAGVAEAELADHTVE